MTEPTIAERRQLETRLALLQRLWHEDGDAYAEEIIAIRKRLGREV